MTWDLFISHASEDKNDFVRPLAKLLREQRIKVWYDEFTLKQGHSLREKIDEGIKNSRFGLVILSENFFSKQWTKKELNGLFSKENFEGEDIILPVWLDLNFKQVYEFSPILSDKLSLSASKDNITEIANNIVDRIKENLISKDDITNVLSTFENMNKFDIKNKISEINYRLDKLYNYENEMEAIDVPKHIVHSGNEIEIEEFYAPIRERIDKKYDFPLGMWIIGNFDKLEYDFIKKGLNKWVKGKMSVEECDKYYFEIDFMINTDYVYIFFGFSNFSITGTDINFKEEFYQIGTKNIA